MRKRIIIGLCILTLFLVGCKYFNPQKHVCEGVYWEYETFLEGEGNKIVYQLSHECVEMLENGTTSNCPLIKSSAYWNDGILYSCQIGTW